MVIRIYEINSFKKCIKTFKRYFNSYTDFQPCEWIWWYNSCFLIMWIVTVLKIYNLQLASYYLRIMLLQNCVKMLLLQNIARIGEPKKEPGDELDLLQCFGPSGLPAAIFSRSSSKRSREMYYTNITDKTFWKKVPHRLLARHDASHDKKVSPFIINEK